MSFETYPKLFINSKVKSSKKTKQKQQTFFCDFCVPVLKLTSLYHCVAEMQWCMLWYIHHLQDTIPSHKITVIHISQFAGHPFVPYFLFYECRLTFPYQWSNVDIDIIILFEKLLFSGHYVTISENNLRYIKENVDW